MQVVVLCKPVPDPASGTARIGGNSLLDRDAASLVLNGNDEYALEAALSLVETHGGEVRVLAMAPASGTEAVRRALAMGASSATVVEDELLAGADLPTTARVLAAAAAAMMPLDLLLVGVDTSDGAAGVIPAAIAARLELPLLPRAAAIEVAPDGRGVNVQSVTAKGQDRLTAPMPAVVSCTQALGAPRYPSLKGVIGARSKAIRRLTVAELGPDLVHEPGWTTEVVAVGDAPQAATGRRIVVPAPDAARIALELLAERGIVQ